MALFNHMASALYKAINRALNYGIDIRINGKQIRDMSENELIATLHDLSNKEKERQGK